MFLQIYHISELRLPDVSNIEYDSKWFKHCKIDKQKFHV